MVKLAMMTSLFVARIRHQNILAFEKDHEEAVVKLSFVSKTTAQLVIFCRCQCKAKAAHNSPQVKASFFTDEGDGEKIQVYQAI